MMQLLAPQFPAMPPTLLFFTGQQEHGSTLRLLLLQQQQHQDSAVLPLPSVKMYVRYFGVANNTVKQVCTWQSVEGRCAMCVEAALLLAAGLNVYNKQGGMVSTTAATHCRTRCLCPLLPPDPDTHMYTHAVLTAAAAAAAAAVGVPCIRLQGDQGQRLACAVGLPRPA
jgi:hypothetical protein